jgi:hypothetical protein
MSNPTPFNNTPEAQAKTVKATALHQALAAVNITEIDMASRERNIPRKEQARLARHLFGKLGLRGISVTAPNYSMAQAVDVRLPVRRDFTCLSPSGDVEWERDPAAQANRVARERVEAILLAAFPNSEDRSDTQSDHFNYRWSIQ